MTLYAYCRVSKNDGTMEIDNQVYAIKEWATKHNLPTPVFFEDECKGDKPIEEREQLPILLKNLKKGDTVVVVEVFRLYRGFAGLQQVYKTIVADKEAEFITLNEKEQILCTSYGDNNDIMQMSMKSMVLIFMALFSELEKRNISARTKRALAERANNGVILGRPVKEKPKNFDEVYAKVKAKIITHNKAMQELGLKPTTYYNFVREKKKAEVVKCG